MLEDLWIKYSNFRWNSDGALADMYQEKNTLHICIEAVTLIVQ